MKKLFSLAGLVLLVVVGLGQSAFQRTMLTTNTVPAGVNGQVLVLVSGVPRWSTNAGSLSLSNVTVFGTLTVSTQLVINGTGPGTIQLYATNGTSIVTISSADSFTSYTLYLPTGIQTNAVLQSTADGHLYWSTDPVLNSVEVTGSGAGYLLIGDASTTNTFKLVGPAAFGSSFTNLWPESPGTNGQVLTMGTNGQWYFGTPGSSGGDTIWTNDNGAIHLVDQSVSQDVRVATTGGLQGYVQQRSDVDTSEVLLRGGVWSLDLYGYGTTNGGAVFVVTHQGSPTLTLLDPAMDFGETAPYIFNTYAPLTNGNILEVQNGGTNQAVVDNAGALSLSQQPNKLGMAGGFATMDTVPILTRVEPLTALTWGATTTISVLPTETNYRTLTLGGDTVFAAGDQAAGRWFTCFVTGAATNCAVSFPSWHFMNSAAPTTLAAGKVASLTVFFTDGTDAAAVANYAVEP